MVYNYNDMYIVYKQVGETPLQCIQRLFDTTSHIYSYAGRLDPMAEGLLLVLVDDECKQAKQYHHLAKSYEYSFVVGLSTDTYDCLGDIIDICYPEKSLDKKVQQVVSALIGTHTFPYPPYSSKTVNGIPLFQYAREHTLHTITVPTAVVQVTEHTLTNVHTTTVDALRKEIMSNIQNVRGDFRQEETIRQWRALSDHPITIYSATITASGGTYVRAIVHEIGNRIGYPTVTTHIKRTRIGEWTQLTA